MHFAWRVTTTPLSLAVYETFWAMTERHKWRDLEHEYGVLCNTLVPEFGRS